jgi:hypothetical protein
VSPGRPAWRALVGPLPPGTVPPPAAAAAAAAVGCRARAFTVKSVERPGPGLPGQPEPEAELASDPSPTARSHSLNENSDAAMAARHSG